MKIKLSKSQWEEMGRKAGWSVLSQNSSKNPSQLPDVITRLKGLQSDINRLESDFYNLTADLRKYTDVPEERWNLISDDCDAVTKSLDNATGRISTMLYRMKG